MGIGDEIYESWPASAPPPPSRWRVALLYVQMHGIALMWMSWVVFMLAIGSRAWTLIPGFVGLAVDGWTGRRRAFASGYARAVMFTEVSIHKVAHAEAERRHGATVAESFDEIAHKGIGIVKGLMPSYSQDFLMTRVIDDARRRQEESEIADCVIPDDPSTLFKKTDSDEDR